MLIPLPGLYQSGATTMEDLAATAKFADFVGVVSLATADGQVTKNELHSVDAELVSLIGCAQRVCAHLALIMKPASFVRQSRSLALLASRNVLRLLGGLWGISLANFNRHNGVTAKSCAQGAKRAASRKRTVLRTQRPPVP